MPEPRRSPGRNRSRAITEQHRRILAACPVCHICGEDIDLTLHYLDPMAGAVDHVIPRAKGGTEAATNKRPAHRRCNRAKSDREYAPIIRRSRSLD